MRHHLHLLGGSGRIGSALIDSLKAQPCPDLSSVFVYCDSTKISDLARSIAGNQAFSIQVNAYADFGLEYLDSAGMLGSKDRHLVMNLRGVNSKHFWLNQPLQAIDLQLSSCRSLIDSNLWMAPGGLQILHFSSQLCDLIESQASLHDICQGLESYRRPYMVSRLHQESLLSANAYHHAIMTTFVRLPAVYGFSDDRRSPWVLNSLCKLKRLGQPVVPRNPAELIYLTHRDPLITFLRALIVNPSDSRDRRTVSYLRPPMLRMTVGALAALIEQGGHADLDQFRDSDSMHLLAGEASSDASRLEHIQLLNTTISTLLKHG